MQSNNLDIDTQILMAMMAPATQVPVASISIEDQRKYIRANINSISKDNKLMLGRILIGSGVPIGACAEGTIVQMNRVTDETIMQMYAVLNNIKNNIVQ